MDKVVGTTEDICMLDDCSSVEDLVDDDNLVVVTDKTSCSVVCSVLLVPLCVVSVFSVEDDVVNSVDII